MSGQHAYYKQRVASVSHQAMIREFSLGWILTDVETSEQVPKGEI